jgi:glycosyltransferase involved in cell wall biosynthesis
MTTPRDAAAAPLFPEVGVIAVVAEPWGGMWLSRHQILTRLSDYFNVVWVNPARPWRHAFSPPRINNPDPAPPPARHFTVYNHPAWLPKFYRPAALGRVTEQKRLREARRILEAAGCRKIVLYVWQPRFARAVDAIDHDVSCYHIADEYSFAEVEHPVSAAERRLIERVDQVIVHSPALMEKKGKLNPRTAFITNGVDYDAFANPAAEPADLAAVARPRIGYVGRLKSQLDWDTLGEIARRQPAWQVVLVGPVGHMGEHERKRSALLAMPNVHYLGNKSVRDIPAYVQHMDVCLLCYALTDYTRYIVPLKLHEYLATGLPVVGSDIRTLREFDHVVRIAHSTDEWCQAIAAALEPSERTPARMEERRRVAREYDWDRLTGRIAGLLCERLGDDYARRFSGLKEAALS